MLMEKEKSITMKVCLFTAFFLPDEITKTYVVNKLCVRGYKGSRSTDVQYHYEFAKYQIKRNILLIYPKK